MFQNRLHTTKCLNDIRAVGIQVPKLAIVPLARPPERIALHELVRLELRTSSETLVEAEGASVLLEEGIDSWQTAIPAVFEIFQGQSAVLLVGFHALL